MMRSLFAFLVLFVLAAPGSAEAQVYAQLTYGNVVKTLARFDALNMQNDEVVDDFAQITECKTFYKNFRDDFAMRARRTALRDEVKKGRTDYPDAYYFTSEMRLGRYDFQTHMFRLEEKSRLVNINSFHLVRLEDRTTCVEGETVKTLPGTIGAILDQPVTIEGLPITEEQSKALVERMNAAKNFDRIIYARFSLMVVYAPPIDPLSRPARYNADAQLLGIEFFEDPKMTKPIWVYTRA